MDSNLIRIRKDYVISERNDYLVSATGEIADDIFDTLIFYEKLNERRRRNKYNLELSPEILINPTDLLIDNALHNENDDTLDDIEIEKERFRQRVKNTKSCFKKRANSRKFFYFVTFTTNNTELCKDNPLLFLELVSEYLKKQGLQFIIILERFKNKDSEFHVHGLTNKPVDFIPWLQEYGANFDINKEIDYKRFDARKFNLYCRPIKSSQKRCIKYLEKAIKETKILLEELYNKPKNLHMYKSNVDLVPCGSSIDIVDKDNKVVIEKKLRNKITDYVEFCDDFFNAHNFENKIDILDNRLYLALSEYIDLFDMFTLFKDKKLPKGYQELFVFLQHQLLFIVCDYLKANFNKSDFIEKAFNYLYPIKLEEKIYDFDKILDNLENIFDKATEYYEEEMFYKKIRKDEDYIDKHIDIMKNFCNENIINNYKNVLSSSYYFEKIGVPDIYNNVFNSSNMFVPSYNSTALICRTDDCGRFEYIIASANTYALFEKPTFTVSLTIYNSISHTKEYASLMPYKYILMFILKGFYLNYLLKFIGYIENIP